MTRLADPALLALAVAGIAVALAWRYGRGPARGLVVPSVDVARAAPLTWRRRARPLLLALRVAVLTLLAVAAARPQSLSSPVRESGESLDVFLVLDVSSSMASEDFQPLNRLEVAKRVISEFVARRAVDRIGLITFARFSTLSCPLTVDRDVLTHRLQEVGLASGDDDGTAIGMALASAVNHLRRSPSKERVVVLLTDGENNRSTIDPETGAALAAAVGVRVYTIGVGRIAREVPLDPEATLPPPRAAFNEDALRAIADATDARYFRAGDVGALEAVFAEIDALEQTEVPTTSYRRTGERFAPFALAALGLALAELLLRRSVLRRLP